MNNFFSTLFKLNWANAGKFAVGIGAGILAAAAAGVIFPPSIVGASVIITTVGGLFGITTGVATVGVLHGYHSLPPPGKVALPQGAIDPKAPIQP